MNEIITSEQGQARYSRFSARIESRRRAQAVNPARIFLVAQDLTKMPPKKLLEEKQAIATANAREQFAQRERGD